MLVVLALMFVICHGVVVAFWPGTAGGGSFVFLTAAPLLAAAACLWRGQRLQPGYDHSYYFIASFIGEHIAHHARALNA